MFIIVDALPLYNLPFLKTDLLNAKEFLCYQYKKVQADYKMYYTGFSDGREKTY